MGSLGWKESSLGVEKAVVGGVVFSKLVLLTRHLSSISMISIIELNLYSRIMSRDMLSLDSRITSEVIATCDIRGDQ